LGKKVPDTERERAARQVADAWQIADVLGNMLMVEENTFNRFTGALRSVVESLLPGATVNPLPEIPNMPPTAFSSVDRQRATESEMIPDSPLAGPFSNPTPPVGVDQVLAEATGRQQLLAGLKLIQERLEPKRARLVEALHGLASTLPNAEAYSQNRVLTLDGRDVLADALLQVCQAVREGEFCRGIELILSQDQTDAGGNDCLAIDLYRRAWSGNRQAILQLLKRLDELPLQGDNFNRAAPSQHGVWHAVQARFNVIIPWPPQLNVVHPWHPDAVEGGRLQAELSPQPEPVSAPEPMPNRSWPLVGERTGRRTPLPELARDENRERQSRYCQGFDPDWWLPALFAAKWRSYLYPREAARESVEQWLELIDRLRIENLGPFGMPERAAELEADRDNDLRLIRDHAPQLHDAVVRPARTPSNSLHLQDAEAQIPASPAELLSENPSALKETRGERGQADNKADNRPKKTKTIPVNPEVLRLAKKIRRDRGKGMSQMESAREFCECDERKAKSLLRQLRRYPHLLE
jgi:hypothetical protein